MARTLPRGHEGARDLALRTAFTGLSVGALDYAKRALTRILDIYRGFTPEERRFIVTTIASAYEKSPLKAGRETEAFIRELNRGLEEAAVETVKTKRQRTSETPTYHGHRLESREQPEHINPNNTDQVLEHILRQASQVVFHLLPSNKPILKPTIVTRKRKRRPTTSRR